MKRVELEGESHDIGGLMGSAYKDEAGRKAAVVYVNAGTGARRVKLEFVGRKGWEARSVTPYVTSERAGDELKRYPAVGVGEAVEIPGRSVVTLEAEFI